MDRAHTQRPHLVAGLANQRASQAQVRMARSAYYPKNFPRRQRRVWKNWTFDADGSPFIGNSNHNYGIGLAFDLHIFDGYARSNRLRIASKESQLRWRPKVR